MRSLNLNYRPEIDGLRSIAVIAVILYHAQINIFGHQPFKGGFVGVDIFFVISGYLITSIILKELNTTGSFSFKHFYERRIRRILPALLFVMLVSLPFAWVSLLPSSFVDFSKSILYSLGFSSNFYFHYSGQQYGAESGLLKPFLHTWSLSVEEQFYILFPITLLVIFKYFKKYLIHILILGFVISLGLSDWSSRNYPSFNFYVLPTRGWELLAGSIIAYFEINSGHRSKNKTLNLILPTIGLLLIGHSILFFDNKMYHPSLYTLSPIIGTCLIIYFLNKNDLITKILSTKLFVGVGLISYSLYLWHYPIFAFARINMIENNFTNQLIIVFLLIFFSILSYKLIELPGRNIKNKFKIIFNFLSLAFLIIIFFNIISINNGGTTARIPQIFLNDLPGTRWDNLKNEKGEVCHNKINGCEFNQNRKEKVFLIGDSHMSILSEDLKIKFEKTKYSFNTSLFDGCLYFPNFDLVNKTTKKIDKYCNSIYFNELEKKLLNQVNSIIIFGGRYPLNLNSSYFDNKEGGDEKKIENGEWQGYYKNQSTKYDNIADAFINSVSNLANKNKIILIYPIPEAGFVVPRALFTSKSFIEAKKLNYKSIKDLEKRKDYILSTSFNVYKERAKSTFEMFDAVKGKNIFRIYPHKIFCGLEGFENRCILNNADAVFYLDEEHPSISASYLINDLIIKKIKKIELNNN